MVSSSGSVRISVPPCCCVVCFPSLPAQLSSSSQTVGIIDFGGASLELAFESVYSNKTVKLYYHNYTLYAHSYLCYGRDQMELRLLANLAQNVTKNGSTVENPCLPSGYQMSKTVDAIWSLPCVTEQHPPCMGLCVRVCVCVHASAGVHASVCMLCVCKCMHVVCASVCMLCVCKCEVEYHEHVVIYNACLCCA